MIKRDIKACAYLALLASVALVSGFVFRETFSSFQYCESFVLWKTIPWTLAPMLICAILAAYFTQKGYGKAVGIAGLEVMMAAGVIQAGCMAWLNTIGLEDNVVLVELNSYPVRLPMAIFIVALSFLRGGALALTICLLSFMRTTQESTLTKSFIAIPAFVYFVSVVFIYTGISLTPLATGIIIIVYAAMVFSATLYYMRHEEEPKAEIIITDKQHASFVIVGLCAVFAITMIPYFIRYWHSSNAGFWRDAILVLSLPSLAFAASLLTIKKDFSTLGCFLLMTGIPLATITLNILWVRLVPQVIIGLGMAMIVSRWIDAIIHVKSRHYAMLWVGLVVLVCISSKLLTVCFNHLQLFCRTMAVNLYITYPLLAFALLIMNLYIKKPTNKREVL